MIKKRVLLSTILTIFSSATLIGSNFLFSTAQKITKSSPNIISNDVTSNIQSKEIDSPVQDKAASNTKLRHYDEEGGITYYRDSESDPWEVNCRIEENDPRTRIIIKSNINGELVSRIKFLAIENVEKVEEIIFEPDKFVHTDLFFISDCPNLKKVILPEAFDNWNNEWWPDSDFLLNCPKMETFIIPPKINGQSPKITEFMFSSRFGSIAPAYSSYIKTLYVPLNASWTYSSFAAFNKINVQFYDPDTYNYNRINPVPPTPINKATSNNPRIREFDKIMNGIHSGMLIIPDNVEINASEFYGVWKLQLVQLSSTMTIIPHRCFDSSGLKSITIPPNVTSMYETAFNNCYNLTNVFIKSNFNFSWFNDSPISQITIPKQVTKVPDFNDSANKTLDYLLLDKDSPLINTIESARNFPEHLEKINNSQWKNTKAPFKNKSQTDFPIYTIDFNDLRSLRNNYLEYLKTQEIFLNTQNHSPIYEEINNISIDNFKSIKEVEFSIRSKFKGMGSDYKNILLSNPVQVFKPFSLKSEIFSGEVLDQDDPSNDVKIKRCLQKALWTNPLTPSIVRSNLNSISFNYNFNKNTLSLSNVVITAKSPETFKKQIQIPVFNDGSVIIEKTSDFIFNNTVWDYFGVDAANLPENEVIEDFKKHLQNQQLFDDPTYIPNNPIITIKSRNETEIIFNYNYNENKNETITASLKPFSVLTLNPEVFYHKLLIELKDNNYEINIENIQQALKDEFKKQINQMIQQSIAVPKYFKNNIDNIELYGFRYTVNMGDLEGLFTIENCHFNKIPIFTSVDIPRIKIQTPIISINELYEKINNISKTIPINSWTINNNEIFNKISDLFKNKYQFLEVKILEVSKKSNVGSIKFSAQPSKLKFKLDGVNENVLPELSTESIVFTINNLELKKPTTDLKIKEINDRDVFNSMIAPGKFFKEDWENKINFIIKTLKTNMIQNPDLWFENSIQQTIENIIINRLKEQEKLNQIILEINFKGINNQNIITSISKNLTINFNIAPTIDELILKVKETIPTYPETITKNNVGQVVANVLNSLSHELPDAFLPTDILSTDQVIQFKENMFIVAIKDNVATITTKPIISDYFKNFKLEVEVHPELSSKKDWFWIIVIAGGGLLLLILLIITIVLARKHKKLKQNKTSES